MIVILFYVVDISVHATHKGPLLVRILLLLRKEIVYFCIGGFVVTTFISLSPTFFEGDVGHAYLGPHNAAKFSEQLARGF